MSVEQQGDGAELLGAAQAAIARRDFKAAAAMLARAEAGRPDDVDIKLQVALVRRASGDLAGAVSALNSVLAIDPYHFVAMLSKASLVEKLAGGRAAAPLYRNALDMAPPEARIPPGLQRPLAHGREVIDQNAVELEGYLQKRVAQTRARWSGESLTRFDEALSIFAGRKKAYVQEPVMFHYPRLAPIPFHDEALFPWLGELEAATDEIRAELEQALSAGDEGFAPYIAYAPGQPVNQWGELNHSRRWSSLWLWKDGVRQDEACAKFPTTTALLERLPMARQEGYAPTAMFSALEARTRIPPHTGSSNTRLLCHLPLVLPGPARFRVGNEVREWRMGKAWVFDDTIEHEAWNDADELRVILIFDIWNPLLSQAERELVTALMAAGRDYYAGD